MKQLLKSFGFSLSLTIAAFGFVLLRMGGAALLVMTILAAIELAFSFDNAVINAQVLGRLSPFWQKLFLSLGIVIAIFGVRIILPLAIVSLTAHIGLGTVADLALHHPHVYAEKLELAHPSITAFGGAFLLMLVLHFLMGEREVQWLRCIERSLRRAARWWVPLLCTLLVIIGLSLLPANPHKNATLAAGLAGIVIYACMNGLMELMGRAFGKDARAAKLVGGAAFATFMYLELLDASLSFDGVIGAFAITSDVVLIALGLGVGALWVRSLTVYMVRRRTLEAYKYLEHGAHYAIGILAAAMLLAPIVATPDFITGVLCLGIIAAALVTSRQAAAREEV
jgi:hypothetical protein